MAAGHSKNPHTTCTCFDALQNAAEWLQHYNQQQQPGQLQPVVQHPRYARVNTLKCSVQEVQQQLLATCHSGSTSSSGVGSCLDLHVDKLLPDVLVFPPNTDLHDHPLVEQGVLILQVCVCEYEASTAAACNVQIHYQQQLATPCNITATTSARQYYTITEHLELY